MTFRFLTVLAVACVAVCGCCASEPVDTLVRHGGRFVPAGEGPAVNCPPFDSIWFDPRSVTDADLGELAPSLIRLRPRRLNLTDQPLTASSAETIAELRRAGLDWIELPDSALEPRDSGVGR